MGVNQHLKRRAVFLDRDGVVIRAVVRDGRPYPVSCADEMELLPGVAEAAALLRDAGYRLIIVTNQPDVARGATTRRAVLEINARIEELLAVDSILTCFHDNAGNCACRKPRPGMLLDAARRFDLDLPRSCIVGDRWSDVEAGRRAGCRTCFIDYGYAERGPEGSDFQVTSLLAAVPLILQLEGLA